MAEANGDDSTPIRKPVEWSAGATLKGGGNLDAKTPEVIDQYGRKQALDHERIQHGRLPPPLGGRHPNFDEATKNRLRGQLESFLLDWKNRTGEFPKTKPKVESFVRELLEREGIRSSSSVVTKQIVSPVFQKLKPRRRRS
jgi:hypothetical protein